MSDDLVDFTPSPAAVARRRVPDYRKIVNNASYVKMLAAIILIAEFLLFIIQIGFAVLLLAGSLNSKGVVDAYVKQIAIATIIFAIIQLLAIGGFVALLRLVAEVSLAAKDIAQNSFLRP